MFGTENALKLDGASHLLGRICQIKDKLCLRFTMSTIFLLKNTIFSSHLGLQIGILQFVSVQVLNTATALELPKLTGTAANKTATWKNYYSTHTVRSGGV